jgi:hypothetical protein
MYCRLALGILRKTALFAPQPKYGPDSGAQNAIIHAISDTSRGPTPSNSGFFKGRRAFCLFEGKFRFFPFWKKAAAKKFNQGMESLSRRPGISGIASFSALYCGKNKYSYTCREADMGSETAYASLKNSLVRHDAPYLN